MSRSVKTDSGSSTAPFFWKRGKYLVQFLPAIQLTKYTEAV